MNPEISIIVPAYNVEKYIETCLSSIRNQSFSNFEVIIIDDGSTDNSGTIAENYSKKDSRFIVIHKKNEGLAVARKEGIQHSSGKYIYYLDSDDYIHPQTLEILFSFAEKENADVVQGGFSFVTCDTPTFPINPAEVSYKNVSKIEIFNLLENFNNSPNDNTGLATIVFWNKLIRRSVFTRFDFNSNVRIHEDQMNIHKVYATANGIILTDTRLYYYRTRNESLVQKRWTVSRLSIVSCYEDRIQTVSNLDFFSDDDKILLLHNLYRKILSIIIHCSINVRRNTSKEEFSRYFSELFSKFEFYFLNSNRKKWSTRDKIYFNSFYHLPRLSIFLFSFIKRK